ncbi:septation protein IspZ [Pseudomonadota bacterium]
MDCAVWSMRVSTTSLMHGFLNLYVVYNYDTDTWVDFKMFGLMGLTLGFMLLQGLYLARYIKEIPAKPDA